MLLAQVAAAAALALVSLKGAQAEESRRVHGF